MRDAILVDATVGEEAAARQRIADALGEPR